MIIDLFNFWREVIVFRILKIHYLVLTRIIGFLIPNCLMWLDPYQFLKTMDMHYISFSVAICGPWKRHNLFFTNTARCTDNFLNIFCAYPVLKKKEALKCVVLAKVQRWKWIWISSVPKSKKDFLFQNQTFFPEIDGHEPACRRQGRSHQTKHIIEMNFYSRKAIERIDQHYFRSLCREFIWFPFESPVLLNEKCVVLYQNV